MDGILISQRREKPRLGVWYSTEAEHLPLLFHGVDEGSGPTQHNMRWRNEGSIEGIKWPRREANMIRWDSVHKFPEIQQTSSKLKRSPYEHAAAVQNSKLPVAMRP